MHVKRTLGAVAAVAVGATTFFAAGGLASAAAPNAATQQVVLHRGGHDATVKFSTSKAGEVAFDVTASAPGVNWAVRGDESSVVSVSADGNYETDIVIPFAQPITRHFMLGHLAAGQHKLTLHFATDRSPAQAKKAVLSGLQFSTYTAGSSDYQAARFAPVLYGRNLEQFGGEFDNSYSDAPLVGWHESTPAATPGHTIQTYSVVWSNEDGGTDTGALLSRWGRTTDIEWIYSVELDQNGNRVPGSDTFQAPAHTTTKFAGKYEGDHPILDTCTSNNNICDTVNDPMRFNLSYQQTRPTDQPREYIMDTNPWTYQVTNAEMQREGKVVTPYDTSTKDPGDQRNYLFLSFKKDTIPPGNGGANWVGAAIEVTLKGSNAVYRSDHSEPDLSIQRDDPAATTVKLPAGTSAADIDKISVVRVVNGTDPGYSVHVTGVERAFFLTTSYLPENSFLTWNGSITLTAANPSAVLWSAS